MAKYRGVSIRPAHPKIFVFSHTRRAEIEYFLDFKNHLETDLLMPKRDIKITPQELIDSVIRWKNTNNDFSEEDGDQVWCVFDVDDFYKNDAKGLLKNIREAHRNGIKIAFFNECFELWILSHFKLVTSPPARHKFEDEIKKAYQSKSLGNFEKNQRCFNDIISLQPDAIKNCKNMSEFKNYEDIVWEKALSPNSNPSTSVHFLIEEILKKHS